ncbi:purine-nucleoside phosphorylase [Ascoidea rubescens DSM 1968]|uniref:Purine nucleoside phosphorylase n=1 Tax=Ascoidea rubescens DSM 1968 TaxID=1344418 RepID=A0A1D2VPW9_9ASCO|nr:purine-nucleoside phosphorylase [Ascoidea rubescens DSM 1968]ODV63660.1 purine-nucleoside phosphorylase [Ascoidea rubescens DSM 1968]
MTLNYLQGLEGARDYILQRLPKELSSPRVLIICGSGLGGIQKIIEKELSVVVSYSSIPGFKESTVSGHEGKLIFGYIGANKVSVMCMVGRLHFYEGYELSEATFPIRVASLLGVSVMIATNAAGGINPLYKPGDLMIISDHINFPGLSGSHPLRGPNVDEFGPRFLPLSNTYDLELRKLFFQSAQSRKITRRIAEGVYAFVSGPTYETRAEVRFLKTAGADAVGMSTVPEVIIAHHCGMRVFALSLITNTCVGDEPASIFDEAPVSLEQGKATHSEVLEYANKASLDVQSIIQATVNRL